MQMVRELVDAELEHLKDAHSDAPVSPPFLISRPGQSSSPPLLLPSPPLLLSSSPPLPLRSAPLSIALRAPTQSLRSVLLALPRSVLDPAPEARSHTPVCIPLPPRSVRPVDLSRFSQCQCERSESVPVTDEATWVDHGLVSRFDRPIVSMFPPLNPTSPADLSLDPSPCQ